MVTSLTVIEDLTVGMVSDSRHGMSSGLGTIVLLKQPSKETKDLLGAWFLEVM